MARDIRKEYFETTHEALNDVLYQKVFPASNNMDWDTATWLRFKEVTKKIHEFVHKLEEEDLRNFTE